MLGLQDRRHARGLLTPVTVPMSVKARLRAASPGRRLSQDARIVDSRADLQLDIGKRGSQPTGHERSQEVVAQVQQPQMGERLPGQQRLASLVGQHPASQVEF
jgi:hypothetical protein